MDIHILNGGIGKHIMFTSVLNKLESKICVSSYYDKIFNPHPMIEASYPSYGWDNMGMKEFWNKFNNILHIEPYFGDFLKKDIHCIEAYHQGLNLNFDGLYHNLHFTQEELNSAENFCKEVGNFVLVQFLGSDKDLNKDLNALGGRNLNSNQSQELINIITNDLGESVLEVNNGVLNFNNTLVTPKLEYKDYCLLTKYCKSFIGIDSCLNHMSAFKENPKKGVVLWRDEEYATSFKYPHNTNLYSKLPLKMKFDSQIIIDELIKVLNNDTA